MPSCVFIIYGLNFEQEVGIKNFENIVGKLFIKTAA